MSKSQVTQELLMDAVDLAQHDTHYSESRKFHACTGSSAIFLSLASGGAATVTVTQQCSMNNVDWYDPVDTTGTALGGVIAAQAVTTGVYIAFTPVLTEYIRFKVHEDNTAACTVTLKLYYRLEV